MSIEIHPIKGYEEYEGVYEIFDDASGLHAFVAVHSTRGGGAVGGTRMHSYPTREEALHDVLRLARSMTFKCVGAGVKYGGGKAVIIGDPDLEKNEALLRSYAESLDGLGLPFYTGEDVGISEEDVQFMFNVSDHFIGRSDQAGDPSPYAAVSTFNAIEVAVASVFSCDNLVGRTVAIKGIGKVGSELALMLSRAGADVMVADIRPDAVSSLMSNNSSIREISTDEILSVEVDIYSPCAMGSEFTAQNYDLVNAKIICGAANNQLHTPDIGDRLFEKGVSYIVDYLANGGGLINVVDELEPGGYSSERVRQRLTDLRLTIVNLLKEASEIDQPMHRVSDERILRILDEQP